MRYATKKKAGCDQIENVPKITHYLSSSLETSKGLGASKFDNTKFSAATLYQYWIIL